mmetsp:Transcript_113389/g.366815  ORF Transcript_113389/g.366815 Transcript_113389/m.366815 type:complete len:224 (-) Transcript_113389:304-975(-)
MGSASAPSAASLGATPGATPGRWPPWPRSRPRSSASASRSSTNCASTPSAGCRIPRTRPLTRPAAPRRSGPWSSGRQGRRRAPSSAAAWRRWSCGASCPESAPSSTSSTASPQGSSTLQRISTASARPRRSRTSRLRRCNRISSQRKKRWLRSKTGFRVGPPTCASCRRSTMVAQKATGRCMVSRTCPRRQWWATGLRVASFLQRRRLTRYDYRHMVQCAGGR